MDTKYWFLNSVWVLLSAYLPVSQFVVATILDTILIKFVTKIVKTLSFFLFGRFFFVIWCICFYSIVCSNPGLFPCYISQIWPFVSFLLFKPVLILYHFSAISVFKLSWKLFRRRIWKFDCITDPTFLEGLVYNYIFVQMIS